MLCRAYNSQIRSLVVDHKLVIWKCILSNGDEIWSDYYAEEKDPWIRLKEYCYNNGIKIIEVRVLAYGIKERTVFQDENGLDGIFIIRGVSKDLSGSSDGITYNYLAFGKLNKETNVVETMKFHWPECAFDDFYEERVLTEDNQKIMFFQRKLCGDNCTCQSKKQT